MSDYNTLNENSNNSEADEEDEKKRVGFNKFAYYNLNTGGYSMNITTYETKIRREIKELKEKKKNAKNKLEDDKYTKLIASKKNDLISTTDNAVFNYLMANVMYNNYVNLNKIRKTQGGIADELCLNRTTVSSSFSKLKRLNIISYKMEGNSFEKIIISPYICWQGEASKHERIIKSLNESFMSKPFERPVTQSEYPIPQ